MKESPETVSHVQRRGSKGDFLASITRNDPRDRRLAKSFKANYDLISKNTAQTERKGVRHPILSNRSFNLENVEIRSINGSSFPSIDKMVELSQLWMSDHSQFWYFLQDEVSK